MDAAERDSTQDWLVPAGAAPPRLGELELKVDQALAIASASEDGVAAVGEAALDAARQARRAAELAETASAAALEARRAVVGGAPAASAAGPVTAGSDSPSTAEFTVVGADADEALRRFTERADRVAARLRAL
jgi:hypothetical protein